VASQKKKIRNKVKGGNYHDAHRYHHPVVPRVRRRWLLLA
jgi:hypothetical protein